MDDYLVMVKYERRGQGQHLLNVFQGYGPGDAASRAIASIWGEPDIVKVSVFGPAALTLTDRRSIAAAAATQQHG